jgi:hypothetical protein
MEDHLVPHHHEEHHHHNTEEPRDRRFEVIATILMTLATLVSAWAGYQSTLWHGHYTLELGETMRLGQRANSKRSHADELRLVDIAMFLNYERALSDGDQRYAQFLRERFRPEMKVALDAWLAQDPLKTAGAPLSPFVMKEYVLHDQQEAESLAEEAALGLQKAQVENGHAEDYVLVIVLMASTLFLAGIETRILIRKAKILLLAVAVLITIIAFSLLATLPVARRQSHSPKTQAQLERLLFQRMG